MWKFNIFVLLLTLGHGNIANASRCNNWYVYLYNTTGQDVVFGLKSQKSGSNNSPTSGTIKNGDHAIIKFNSSGKEVGALLTLDGGVIGTINVVGVPDGSTWGCNFVAPATLDDGTICGTMGNSIDDCKCHHQTTAGPSGVGAGQDGASFENSLAFKLCFP